MNARSRRAFSLVQLIAMLPLVMAIITVSYRICNRATLVMAHEREAVAEDSVMRYLVRRMQQDTATAERAAIRKETQGDLLVLSSPDRTVLYQCTGKGISRTEQSIKGGGSTIDWALRQTGVAITLEGIDSSPRVVWLTFARRARMDLGNERPMRLAAAAVIGRGLTHE